MIALIIPVKRMPKGMGPFDYRVPTELEKIIRPGQLVRIPLRKSEVFGLVLSLDTNSTVKGIKDIHSLVHEEPFVTERHLRFLEQVAALYGVSISTVAKMSLLPLQKRKLANIDLSPLQPSTQTTPTPTTIHHYHSFDEKHALLKHIVEGITLVLVPEVYQIERTVHQLTQYIDAASIGIWHSDMSVKDQFAQWVAIRNKKTTCIVGTRGAALLPIPHLRTVIIDREHDTNHKHWDQLPRFHTKDLAYLLREQGVALHQLSYSPSTKAYYDIHKHRAEGSIALKPISNLTVVNMQDEWKSGNKLPLAERVQEAIQNATADIFIHVHRLGYATSIGCQTCGYVATCQQCRLPLVYHKKNNALHCHYCKTRDRLPKTCPSCNQPELQLRGTGTQRIEALVEKLIADKPHTIVRIDSDTGAPDILPEGPVVIIGTSMALPYVRWDTTDVIVSPDIDTILHVPEHEATETAWHDCMRLAYERNQGAVMYLQTQTPEHLLYRSLREPERFYRSDLNARMAFGYPPYTYLVRYSYGHPYAATAQATVDHLVDMLRLELTDKIKHITIGNSYQLHPGYYRHRHWYGFVVKLHPDTWVTDLALLNKYIPHQWKIDPNPISLLSP